MFEEGGARGGAEGGGLGKKLGGDDGEADVCGVCECAEESEDGKRPYGLRRGEPHVEFVMVMPMRRGIDEG